MNEEVIIKIDGTIDSYGWMASNVRWQLDDAKGKKVRCQVNSMGGDVAQAIAISHMLADHGDVIVELIGFTASAATFLGFGAKSIEAHEDGLWLMHKCSTNLSIYQDMNSDQIQTLIDDLTKTKKNADAIDCMIAQKYLNRSKSAKSMKDILDLMTEERWMPMSEVLNLGFVDKIIPGNSVTDSMRNMIFHNCTDLKMPLPPQKPVTASVSHDANNSTSSAVKDVLTAVVDFFKGHKTEDTVNNNIQFTMNKNFEFVNLLLKVEGVNDNAGQITLTAEQMTAINDALKNHSAELQAATNKATTAETSLQDTVKSLDALSDTVKGKEKIEDKVAAIKEVFAKVPGAIPSVNPAGAEADKFSDCRKDEINNF